ncbi:MAG: ATP-binding protein [Candidatus Aminicenantaceae bacterium]
MNTLSVRSDLSELNKIRAYLKRNMQILHLSEEDYYIIELSLLEICINIIRYAYPNDENGEIFLKTWQDEDRVYLEIRDNGVPFDPRHTKTPDIDEIMKTGKQGGLGVFLTRKLMDGFEYTRIKEQNILTIFKILNP